MAAITREEAAEAAALVARSGSIRAAHRETGIACTTLARRLRRAAEWGLDGNAPGPAPEGFAIVENAGSFDAAGNLIRQSVRTRREPGEVYVPPPDHLVKGESALTEGAEGRLLLKWTKTDRRQVDAFRATVAAFREAFAGAIPPAPASVAPVEIAEDLLTVLPLADLHLGMLSWGRETGASYDLAIAERLFRATLGRLIDQAPHSAVCVLLGLGDLTHANDDTARTKASGNVLDVDGRHDKVVLATVRLVTWAVERALAKFGRVVVRLLKGNHDPDVAYGLAVAVAMRFEADPRVEVDLSPSLFWFYRWGEVGLMATHGHNVKPDRMPAILADHWRITRQVPALFGRCYFGHIHHETAKADGHTKAESFGTLAPPDGWHAGRAYNAERAAAVITHHKRQPDYLRGVVSLMPGATDVEEVAA